MGIVGWLRKAGLVSRSTWVTCDETWTMRRLTPLLDRTDPSTGGPALLVLDDAHRLTASTMSGIRRRLKQNPSGTRILLTSQRTPENDWLELQLSGQLTVLNGEFLRLDADESSSLVAAHARTQARQVAATIAERADGWCAAVVLMARALGDTSDPITAAARLETLGVDQADRIADEAFATLSERERHVLFCVATEPLVSAEVAAQLTKDSQAGNILAQLSSVGLLVTTVASKVNEPVRFTVHPLLGAVLRRRIAARGVDARRAAATVRRAVQTDLARGETADALRRLLATGNTDEATNLIATSGTTLIFRGHASAVSEFAQSLPELVEADPRLWLQVAYVHWLADDLQPAMALVDRILENQDRTSPADIATARLMRARLGLEPTAPAIAAAQAALTVMGEPAAGVAGAALTYELATTLCWHGDLLAGEQYLNDLLQLADILALPVLERFASSQLAISLYLQGRHDAAISCVNGLRVRLDDQQTPVPSFVEQRCRVVVDLIESAGPPPHDPLLSQDPEEDGPIHGADPTTRFLARLRRSRLHLAQGSPVAARAALDLPFRGPVPTHLRARLTLERGLLAVLAHDRTGLKEVRLALMAADDPAAADLIGGWLADLDGDRTSAETAWLAATEAADTMRTQAFGLALLAQVRADLGKTRAAQDALLDALALTETAQYATPFLGWVRHGRPMSSLLAEVAGNSSNGWAAQLRSALSQREGILAFHQIDPQKGSDSDQPAASLVLTSRERAVLDELGRGATYADIASRLVVSENTVKTHVSSLYAKLSVNRRSEALTTARQLRLL